MRGALSEGIANEQITLLAIKSVQDVGQFTHVLYLQAVTRPSAAETRRARQANGASQRDWKRQLLSYSAEQ